MTKIADLSPSQLALTSVPPGPRERRVALIVIGSSVATLALMTPFARVPLARVDAFIPSYEAALAISDLITACLLFGQFLRLRLAALLLLAAAYLFDVLLIVPHALTFPGVFTPSGLLGARPQTTAWIYAFWHGGVCVNRSGVCRSCGEAAATHCEGAARSIRARRNCRDFLRRRRFDAVNNGRTRFTTDHHQWPRLLDADKQGCKSGYLWREPARDLFVVAAPQSIDP